MSRCPSCGEDPFAEYNAIDDAFALANKLDRRAAENENTAAVYRKRFNDANEIDAMRLADLAQARADAYRTARLDVFSIFGLTPPDRIGHNDADDAAEEDDER